MAVSDFLKNTLADLQNKALIIEENAPKKRETQDGYITILGAKNIQNKIRQMLEETKERLYVMASFDILETFRKELEFQQFPYKKRVLHFLCNTL